jgi:6,7-dimethyl-8-ribityllumazine synthase
VRTFRGSPEGRGRRFAVVASRFNEVVVAKLVEGTVACLRTHDVADDDLDLAWVPGAFELPLAARRLAESGEYDAVICLGAVIRGQTAHFEYIAGEAARGIALAGQETAVPVIFGVLTTENLDQALDRAGGEHGNKGWDAALAAMEMAGLLDSLPKAEPASRDGEAR